MNRREECWLGQAPRTNARDHRHGLFKNAASVNSREVSNLDPDEICERPFSRNVAMHKSQDYQFNEDETQHYQ